MSKLKQLVTEMNLGPEVVMKRLQRLPVFLVLCVALAVPVACGDDPTGLPSGLVDSWTLTRIQDCDFDSGTGDFGTLTLRSNGTYTYTMDGEVEDEGTFSVSGDALTITSSTENETDTGSFTLSGNTLVITFDENSDCPQTNTLTRS